jgi:hypothetical protein
MLQSMAAAAICFSFFAGTECFALTDTLSISGDLKDQSEGESAITESGAAAGDSEADFSSFLEAIKSISIADESTGFINIFDYEPGSFLLNGPEFVTSDGMHGLLNGGLAVTIPFLIVRSGPLYLLNADDFTSFMGGGGVTTARAQADVLFDYTTTLDILRVADNFGQIGVDVTSEVHGPSSADLERRKAASSGIVAAYRQCSLALFSIGLLVMGVIAARGERKASNAFALA